MCVVCVAVCGLICANCAKSPAVFFGSGESTGSIGVVTVNMPRIAYLSADEGEFFTRLDRMMDIAARSLKIKRTTVGKLMEEGLYPYTKRYLGSFDNHFSTIGLLGMNEAGLNAAWLRKDLTHEETQEFAVRVLNHMRERLSDYQDSSVCDADGYILYTTATCPNCRAVKPLLEKSGLCYTERDVDEYIEEATALGLRQAPILAVQSGNKTVLYTGVAQIKAFCSRSCRYDRHSGDRRRTCGSYRRPVCRKNRKVRDGV